MVYRPWSIVKEVHMRFSSPPNQQAYYEQVWNLVRQIPFSRAMELLITGRLMKADEALRCGLVSKVVPLAQLLDEARALAADICSCGPLAVQAIKRSVYHGLRTTLAEHYEIESELSSKVFMTEDASEGLAAFREKRKPNWKLR